MPRSTEPETGSKRPRRADPDTNLTAGLPRPVTTACKRCRNRKMKCTGESSSCVGCAKAQVPCLIADPSAPRDYTRAEVCELEAKLAHLESVLSRRAPPSTVRVRSTPQSHHGDDGSPGETPGARSDRYVGDESGLGYFSSKLQALSTHTSARLGACQGGHQASFVYHEPHPMPAQDVAALAVNEYFRETHVAHPMLDPQKIWTALDLHSSLRQGTSPLSRPEPQDLFQLNMVMAIGSVLLFRRGQLDLHPFGFFTAALETKPPSASCFNSLEDIENLILIAHFGVYYNIGCSIWEISRLCIRIAIELGLHLQLPNMCRNSPLSDIDRCRRVFWESYLLDRLSSSTLGRPVAIDDASISTGLPGSSRENQSTFRPSLSVSNWLIGLSRLSSKIHHVLISPSRPTPLGLVHGKPQARQGCSNLGELLATLKSFNNQLRTWRQRAPVFDTRTCIHEYPEFYDLSHQEVRLRLMRWIIDRLPSGAKMAHEALVGLTLESASTILSSFEALRHRGLVTFTRAYTHLIFVAGLVVAFSIKSQTHEERGQRSHEAWTSEVDVEAWLGDLSDRAATTSDQSVWDVLDTAERLLGWLTESMPDVAIYTQIFMDLKQELVSSKSHGQVSSSQHDQDETGVQNFEPLSSTGVANGSQQEIRQQMEQQQPPDEPRRDPDFDYPGARNGFQTGQGFPPDANSNVLDLCSGLHDGNGQFFANGMRTRPVSPMWPLTELTGMEGLDAAMSDYIWDTMIPWEASPSAFADNNFAS